MSHGSGVQRTVSVEGLARVEGEGSLRVEVHDGEVTDVELVIFEPPRYFEALLVGRNFTEAPDITSRICGICPVAYQMSACNAMEDACGVVVDDRVRALRRLLYCGEWIQSHALHVYLLHAPDFFGCQDAVELAGIDPAAVERGLDLKRVGNEIMETVGGRGRPSRQRPCRRFLPCTVARGDRRAARASAESARPGARRLSSGWLASSSPTWRASIVSSPCTRRTATPSRRAARPSPTAWT